MTPSEINVVDAPLTQRADRYRAEAERQRQQEEAKRINDEAARVTRSQQEQAAGIWTRAQAEDFLEGQRQKRERQAKDEDLERELKRMRFERMYIPQQPPGHMREPWWSPFTEILKILAPILVATAPLWVPPLMRHFRRSIYTKAKRRRRRMKKGLARARRVVAKSDEDVRVPRRWDSVTN